MPHINIKYQNNHTGLKDIIIEIFDPKIIFKFDLFYFILEEEPRTINKGKERFVQLLYFWIKEIRSIKKDEYKYLPISFTENYLGVFKIYSSNKNVIFKYGYLTHLFGDKIKPSSPNIIDVHSYFKEDNTTEEFVILKKELLIDVEKSIHNFLS